VGSGVSRHRAHRHRSGGPRRRRRRQHAGRQKRSTVGWVGDSQTAMQLRGTSPSTPPVPGLFTALVAACYQQPLCAPVALAAHGHVLWQPTALWQQPMMVLLC
jgi:hypothetical protein